MQHFKRFAAALVVFSFVNAGALTAQTLNTTTTLAAETGNNTSAADSFQTQANGNLGASNISKVPISQLLYGGNNTRVYVHFMPWFGGANHMNVGYTSDDATQVHRQVDDMLSRGVRGAIVDWYGPSAAHAREDQTTQLLRNEAESRGGAFEFAVVEDVGAIQACANTTGCDLTQQVISDIDYANATYFSSPAYMRANGRPLLFFFGLEAYPQIDWNAVKQSALGNALFIFRNSVAYSYVATDGGFSWIGLGDPLSFGPSYLDNFYQLAQQNPAMQTFGSAYKGFNDTLAAWGRNRIMDQNCGQAWLQSLAEAGRYWSPTDQLPNIQLVTWNDYEEGSELESGIDNCVSVSASVSGATLNWAISGDESTVHHYTIFATTDGQNLASLGDVPAGTHSLDLSTRLPAGNYSLYVKAIGQPTLTNKMSSAVAYGGSGAPAPGSNGGPDIALSLTPGSMTIAQGTSGSANISVAPQAGFSGSVTFACSNLPANAVCQFAPASLAVNGSAVSTTVKIATTTTSVTGALPRVPANPLGNWFNFSSAFGVAGFVLSRRRSARRNVKRAVVVAATVFSVAVLVACGGTGMKTTSTSAAQASATPRGNYQVIVTATSGSLHRSATLTLAVD